MTPEQLEHLLRRWGWANSERPPCDADEISLADATPCHPLVRAAQFPPGEGVMSGRASKSMARLRGVPDWGFQPTVCTEDRTYRISTPDDTPPEIQRVQRASLELQTADPLRGLCLRVNYCTCGSHWEKAQAVSLKYGKPVKLKRYRDEVAFARVWMMGRLAAG